jgi:hypothetical protein
MSDAGSMTGRKILVEAGEHQKSFVTILLVSPGSAGDWAENDSGGGGLGGK